MSLPGSSPPGCRDRNPERPRRCPPTFDFVPLAQLLEQQHLAPGDGRSAACVPAQTATAHSCFPAYASSAAEHATGVGGSFSSASERTTSRPGRPPSGGDLMISVPERNVSLGLRSRSARAARQVWESASSCAPASRSRAGRSAEARTACVPHPRPPASGRRSVLEFLVSRRHDVRSLKRAIRASRTGRAAAAAPPRHSRRGRREPRDRRAVLLCPAERALASRPASASVHGATLVRLLMNGA
jgi:hypothetical protein